MNEKLSSIDSAHEYLVRAEEEAQAAFELWAPSHAEPPVCVIPYDLERFPGQRFDILRHEATPSLDIARYAGEKSLGAAAYQQLLDGYRKLGVVEGIRAKAADGISTLVATAHLKDVLDTAIVHNALFVASGDEGFAAKNIIIANPMMKRLGINIDGEVFAVTDVLRFAGPIIFALPNAALNYGVSRETLSQYGRAFAPVFKEAGKQGSAVHWALSGTRAKNIHYQDGSLGKMLPLVDEGVANIVRRRTPNALGVVIDLNQDDPPSRVLPARELQTAGDVHRLMAEIAQATSEITCANVPYGLPAGAEIIDARLPA